MNQPKPPRLGAVADEVAPPGLTRQADKEKPL